MQAIYSYHVCQKANYQISLDFLEDKLRPGYTNKEILTENEIRENIKLHTTEYEKNYLLDFPKNCFKESLAEKKLVETSQYFVELNKTDIENIINYSNASFDLFEKCCLIYFSILTDLNNYFINSNSKKNFEFLYSFFTQENTQKLIEECKKNIQKNKFKPTYKNENGFLNDLIKNDIEKYNLKENQDNLSIHNNKTLSPSYFVTEILFNSPTLEDFFENFNIYWNDDSSMVKHKVFQSLIDINKPDTDKTVEDVEISSKEGTIFFNKLVRKTISNEKSYLPWLANNTKNWDVNRIQELDRILILMALCELLEFENIPPKATLNEYLEIAKHYCSPKSRQFVNGIIDGIFKELTRDKKIKKSGKGLS